MRILVRCETSSAAGGGHAMRCLALAEEAALRGHHVTIITEEPEILTEHKDHREIEVLQTHTTAGSHDDNHHIIRSAIHSAPSVIIFDGPNLKSEIADVISALNITTLIIDDDGLSDALGGTLILNPNIWADRQSYPGISTSGLLLGPEYILLRSAITRYRRHPVTSSVRRILVTMGASDPPNFTGEFVRVAKTTGWLRNIALDIIVGPLNRRRDELLQQAHGCSNVTLHINPRDFTGLLSSSDIALSAAGTTLWELFYLAVPTIPVVIAENQRRNAEWLVRKSLAPGILTDPATALLALRDLADSAARRSHLAMKCSGLIDARGATRVLDALESAEMKIGSER